MLIILSPAQTLDFESATTTQTHSEGAFTAEAAELIAGLQALSVADLQALMGISEPLATLNAARFAAWRLPHTLENARQAVLAFSGSVYAGLGAADFSEVELAFAQRHVRILSGLYGALRPLDLIQPYRLEMQTPLPTAVADNLYAFWANKITDALNAALAEAETDVLVNLASNEYLQAIQRKRLRARLITPQFKSLRNGKYRTISFYAKEARGMMARYAIKRQLTAVNDVQYFTGGGYAFNTTLSTESVWTFTRDAD
jgi:uncharacterized protein